jgi:hypothetical protein
LVAVPPMKPVTLGVLLIRCQVSSVISISTSTYPGKNFRSLIDFWPDFISTTSSTGTSTWPNLSCIPVRWIRSSSVRCTLFSNPEYA